jgi:hypothetical protein
MTKTVNIPALSFLAEFRMFEGSLATVTAEECSVASKAMVHLRLYVQHHLLDQASGSFYIDCPLSQKLRYFNFRK